VKDAFDHKRGYSKESSLCRRRRDAKTCALFLVRDPRETKTSGEEVGDKQDKTERTRIQCV